MIVVLGKSSCQPILMQEKYKIIPIANTVGSKHPFAGMTVIEESKKKLSITHPQIWLEAFMNMLNDQNFHDIVIHNLNIIFLGPEVKMA